MVGLPARHRSPSTTMPRSTLRRSGVKVVTGYTTAATVVRLAQTLLDKRGGYLSNDIFPPGVWLDNVPSWEFGVLVQIRDMSREMRLDFSRSQSQSAEDPDLGGSGRQVLLGQPQLGISRNRKRIPQRDRLRRTLHGSDSPIRNTPKRSSMPAPTICAIGSPASKRASAACRNASAAPLANVSSYRPRRRHGRRAKRTGTGRGRRQNAVARTRRRIFRSARPYVGAAAAAARDRPRFQRRAREQERARQPATDHSRTRTDAGADLAARWS